MPFKSEKQRRFLWAEHPEIAKRWAHEYPESNKNLPMYADKSPTSESKEKEPESKEKRTKVSYITLANTAPDDISISDMMRLCVNNRVTNMLNITPTNTGDTSKTADSKQEIVDIPHSSKPVYAGEERNNGTITGDIPDGKNISGTNSGCGDPGKQTSNNAINELLTKLSVVLSPHIEQTMENMRAEREGRVARRIPRNRGIKQYPVATPSIPLPMGMQQQQPQHAQNQQQLRPVGGGSHPQFNPINAFGAISSTGEINGNAAFGAKNSPDSSKIAEVIKRANNLKAFEDYDAKMNAMPGTPEHELWLTLTHTPLPEGFNMGDLVAKHKELLAMEQARENAQNLVANPKIAGIIKRATKSEALAKLMSLENADPADVDYYMEEFEEEMAGNKAAASTPAWQRAEGKNDEGGLNAKGRASYNKATGGHLKAPVTESNPKGSRAKRQNSFCARMCGMKRVNTGAGTAKDPDSRINKSLRKWNCKCSSAMEFGMKMAVGPFALPPSNNPQDPRVQLGNLVGPQQTQAYQQRVQRGATAMHKLMGKPMPAAPNSMVKVTGPLSSATPLR